MNELKPAGIWTIVAAHAPLVVPATLTEISCWLQAVQMVSLYQVSAHDVGLYEITSQTVTRNNNANTLYHVIAGLAPCFGDLFVFCKISQNDPVAD